MTAVELGHLRESYVACLLYASSAKHGYVTVVLLFCYHVRSKPDVLMINHSYKPQNCGYRNTTCMLTKARSEHNHPTEALSYLSKQLYVTFAIKITSC